MGYHPETLAFSFPPYPRGGTSLIGHPKPWNLARALYALKPWIGFDIWHIDPEKPNTGNRQDDSCGWFDRTPGEYKRAVTEILRDKSEVQAIQNAIDRAIHQPAAFSNGWKRMTPADCLAVTMMIAMRLEHLRRCERRNTGKLALCRYAETMKLATKLALNEIDNLQTAETPSSLVKSIASALNRRFRPWWKHPRWHVHHWKINFDLARNVRRMFDRCVTCRKSLGFGCSPLKDSRGLHHMTCAHGGVAANAAAGAGTGEGL